MAILQACPSKQNHSRAHGFLFNMAPLSPEAAPRSAVSVILNLTHLLVQLFGRTVIFVFLGFPLVNRKKTTNHQPNDQPWSQFPFLPAAIPPSIFTLCFSQKWEGAGEQIVFVLCHVTKQPWRLA